MPAKEAAVKVNDALIVFEFSDCTSGVVIGYASDALMTWVKNSGEWLPTLVKAGLQIIAKCELLEQTWSRETFPCLEHSRGISPWALLLSRWDRPLTIQGIV